MLELTVTASRLDKKPAVMFYNTNCFAYFHLLEEL
jgi:hypothetical protein